MKTKIFKITTALALVMTGMCLVPNTALAAQSTQVFDAPYHHLTSASGNMVTPQSEQRSITQVEGRGLKLETKEGDSISIDQGLATWRDASGSVVAQIKLTTNGNANITFAYDPITHFIAPLESLTSDRAATGCMPKWAAWGWNILWGGMVCLPLSVGVGGIATPIAGVVTEAACNAAGGALTTVISC